MRQPRQARQVRQLQQVHVLGASPRRGLHREVRDHLRRSLGPPGDDRQRRGGARAHRLAGDRRVGLASVVVKRRRCAVGLSHCSERLKGLYAFTTHAVMCSIQLLSTMPLIPTLYCTEMNYMMQYYTHHMACHAMAWHVMPCHAKPRRRMQALDDESHRR